MLRKWRDSVVRQVATRHIAGTDLSDAMRVGTWADRAGHRVILSPWAGDGEGRKEMMDNVRNAAAAVHRSGLDSAILSVKLNALGFDRSAFADLWDETWERGIRLHVDSLGPELADATFRLLEWACARTGGRRIATAPDEGDAVDGVEAPWNGEGAPSLGVTLPSRWRRSLSDAARAADLGLAARIVKGQWTDPVHTLDERTHYERIADRLMERNVPVGIATHDVALARRILNRSVADGGDVEVEQFFSLPHNGRDLALETGVPYRLYIAYGSPALPYNIRFSLTRPEMALWMASDYLLRSRRAWETA